MYVQRIGNGKIPKRVTEMQTFGIRPTVPLGQATGWSEEGSRKGSLWIGNCCCSRTADKIGRDSAVPT